MRDTSPQPAAFWAYCGSSRATPLPTGCERASAMPTTTGIIGSTRPAAPWDGATGCWACSIPRTSPPSRRHFTRCSTVCNRLSSRFSKRRAPDQTALQLPRLHLHRSRLGQGTHAADGVGLSFPPDCRRGTSALAAQDRAGKRAPVQKRIAEMLRLRIDLRRCHGLPFSRDPLVIFLFNPFPESGMRQVVANLEQSLREHPGRCTCSTTTRCWNTRWAKARN